MANNYVGKGRLDGTKAPALPFAPVVYDRQYQDSLNNILRQYFASNDNLNNSLIGVDGGHFLTFPHIAASDTTDQYTTNNTATKVLWDTLDASLGFTLNNDNTATPTYSGTYKIDYSLQFANSDNALHYAYVWLQIDGVDVPASGSKFTVPARKSVGNDGYLVAYSSVTFSINQGQKVALYWAVSQAKVLAPAADGIYMEAYPAQTVPFAMPSIPSALGSIVFVSGVTP
jgi:hypothetical protein